MSNEEKANDGHADWDDKGTTPLKIVSIGWGMSTTKPISIAEQMDFLLRQIAKLQENEAVLVLKTTGFVDGSGI